jgi:hypothetical protein
MSKRKNASRDESAVNAAVGGMLSWIAGKHSVERGTSPTDGALGEILSWITGKGGRKNRR